MSLSLPSLTLSISRLPSPVTSCWVLLCLVSLIAVMMWSVRPVTPPLTLPPLPLSSLAIVTSLGARAAYGFTLTAMTLQFSL